MSAGAGRLRRGLARLRRSMTAQISLSITAVSILIIAVYVVVTGQFVRAELREENELALLPNLAFFRDGAARAPDWAGAISAPSGASTSPSSLRA
jgi:hypothetical protein